MLRLLAGQLDAIGCRLRTLEAQLIGRAQGQPDSQCLATIPGVGPISAVSFGAACRPQDLPLGRHFAAWLGLTPKEKPTGDDTTGRISRQGDQGLRKLLVLGATAVIRFAKAGRPRPGCSILLARRPRSSPPLRWPTRWPHHSGHDGERRDLPPTAEA